MDSLFQNSNENQKTWEEETDEEIFNRAHRIFFSSPEESDGEHHSPLKEEQSVKDCLMRKPLPNNSTPFSLLSPKGEDEANFDMSPIESTSTNLTRMRKSERVSCSSKEVVSNLRFDNSFTSSNHHCCRDQNKNEHDFIESKRVFCDNTVQEVGSRKRRRCKVQCVVVNPPTQNCILSAASDKINVPPVSLSDGICRNAILGQLPGSRIRPVLSAIPPVSSVTKLQINKCQEKAGNPTLTGIKSGKELEDEIEDINSLRQSQDKDTIGTFETQAPIWIEPDIIDDLLKSDNSIYDQLSDTEDRNFDEQSKMSNASNGQEAKNTDGVEEICSVEDSLPLEQHANQAATDANSEDSSSDLFITETSENIVPVGQTTLADSNDWLKLNDLSSQEISKQFEFRLSESDDNNSDKSCGSDELFP